MIKKLDIIRDSENCVDAFGDTHNVAGHNVISKVNELINTVNELEHTRKALDISVDALKEINDSFESIMAKALEQITALEQKD